MTTTLEPAATTLQDFELVDVDSITIGDRYRQEPGKDLNKLAESIDNIGLLNPIVLTTEHILVAGHRRLLAVQQLGYEQIEAHIIRDLDEAALLLAEHDENVCRVNFTMGEARALYNRRKQLLEPLAKARQTAGEVSDIDAKGKTSDAAAAGTGLSSRTLERATEIEHIANDPEQPEQVRELAETVLAAVDADEKPVNTALTEIKTAVETAKGSRGQRKTLTAAVAAFEKHAAALYNAFTDDDEPVDNFDADITLDDVKDGFKVIRSNVAFINKLAKTVGA